MEHYKKTFRFKNEHNLANTKLKIKNYFEFYNFQYEEQDENNFIFFKKFSFLSGWKFNPLHWESQVNIQLTENAITIKYVNEGNAHITPFAFNELFIRFFSNLQRYVSKSIDFKENNRILFKKAKQKVVFQFLIVFVFMGLLYTVIHSFFGQSKIMYLAFMIACLLPLKLVNQYWQSKNDTKLIINL
ncbi:hypothetical protein [Polaribacter sp. Hel_I_88]|uniref:hypothetical protein n=1 Tax=Polaribacter sp. Hel_I_88 TaxID=1250006 RepID=UPI00047C78B6|nr:hypothetical protein [Polaribacter sp. Hel_I_88]